MVYIGTLRHTNTPELFRVIVDEHGFTVYLKDKHYVGMIPYRYYYFNQEFITYFHQEFIIPPIPLYQHIISLLPAETQQSPTPDTTPI